MRIYQCCCSGRRRQQHRPQQLALPGTCPAYWYHTTATALVSSHGHQYPSIILCVSCLQSLGLCWQGYPQNTAKSSPLPTIKHCTSYFDLTASKIILSLLRWSELQALQSWQSYSKFATNSHRTGSEKQTIQIQSFPSSLIYFSVLILMATKCTGNLNFPDSSREHLRDKHSLLSFTLQVIQ